MPHETKVRIISGHLDRLLFSPKGGIEGLLMTVDDAPVQVSMDPATVDVEVLSGAVGRKVEVTAVADRSPKTKQGIHPVYTLKAVTKIAGKRIQPRGSGIGALTGIVASIHYARHGEPNGVILESGEFVHTRPPGMERLKLVVGARVVARGKLRNTVLGTVLLEAESVNRKKME